MYEKRTDRLELPRQLRVGPELARAIRQRATVNRRTIQAEILVLLEVALKWEEVGNGQGASGAADERDDSNRAIRGR